MGHPNPEIWKWNQGRLWPQVLGDINSGLREPFEGIYVLLRGFPGGTSGKEPTCQSRRHKKHGFDPWVGKIPWRKAWQPTPEFLPGESLWTEEPGGLQSIGSHRVGHDWSGLTCTHVLLNQAWVLAPACSKVNTDTSSWWSAVFTAGCRARSPSSSGAKDPNSSIAFRERQGEEGALWNVWSSHGCSSDCWGLR